MCLAVYLATVQPLPVVDRAPLVLEPAAEATAARLRGHLSLPHLYFVASHEGCGCGFVLDHGEGTDEDCSERQSSALALRALLVEAAARGPAELLVCTDGCEAERPKVTRAFDPEAFEVRLGEHALIRL